MATTSEWEVGHRAARIERNMPPFLQNFDAIWDERKWELELGLKYFETYDFAGKSLADLGSSSSTPARSTSGRGRSTSS